MQLRAIDEIPRCDHIFSSDDTLLNHPVFGALHEHLGSGSFGIVVGNTRYCVKIVGKEQLGSAELRFADWASRMGVGPKLMAYGTLVLPLRQLERWATLSTDKELPVPQWIAQLPLTQTVDTDYMVFERWDTSLWHVQQRYPLSDHLIEPVLAKFHSHLEIMRTHGVVHGDLLPRNILVRMKGDQIVDLCFTDFADAIPARRWFLNDWVDEKFRDLTLRGLLKLSFKNDLQEMIRQTCERHVIQPLQITSEECFRRWLLYNPHNLDNCVLYSICALLNKPVTIKIPPYFNFDLAWDDNGCIDVAFCNEEFEQTHRISGFKTMNRLRTLLKLHGSSRLAKCVFLTRTNKVIGQENEHNFYASSCIVPDPHNRFRLCIFMKSVEAINLA